MAMGLEVLVSMAYNCARKRGWNSAIPVILSFYRLGAVASAILFRATVNLMDDTGDGFSFQIISIMAVAVLEVCLRATRSTHKRFFAKLVMGREFTAAEWVLQLEVCAIQSVTQAHAEVRRAH